MKGPIDASKPAGLELRVPPVAVVLVIAIAMWLVANGLPSFAFDFPGRRWMVLALLIAGGVCGVAGVVSFRRARTTVDPRHPDKASRVVDSGIYRFTRNPMYLGLLLILAAWSLHLSSIAALAGLAGFVIYMTRFQIVPEERLLHAKFGEAYGRYLASVRRWL